MVLAYHIIFSFYGFWLPNDSRGSWSDWIRKFELLRFGNATKTLERRSLAKRQHDSRRRNEAKSVLKFPPVKINGVQALSIANGFIVALNESGYLIHACAIMPDHVHLVIARFTCKVEQIVRHLKGRATQQLIKDGVHPLAGYKDNGVIPSPWARGTGWKKFLNTPEDILRSIRYVEDNPVKDGLPAQRWKFVPPYEV